MTTKPAIRNPETVQNAPSDISIVALAEASRRADAFANTACLLSDAIETLHDKEIATKAARCMNEALELAELLADRVAWTPAESPADLRVKTDEMFRRRANGLDVRPFADAIACDLRRSSEY